LYANFLKYTFMKLIDWEQKGNFKYMYAKYAKF